jgi:hypothetical protein
VHHEARRDVLKAAVGVGQQLGRHVSC